MLLYGHQVYAVGQWFMALDNPGASQSAFVSVVWGAGAAWFGLYVGSGKNDEGSFRAANGPGRGMRDNGYAD